MTIKASGSSLSFTEIEAEWDNDTPWSMSEFYSGGSGTVHAGAKDGDGNAIPSSSTISFSHFYDTTYFVTSSASSTAGTVAVPAGATHIYIVTAYGAGGGGYTGGDYDQAGEVEVLLLLQVVLFKDLLDQILQEQVVPIVVQQLLQVVQLLQVHLLVQEQLQQVMMVTVMVTVQGITVE